MIYIHSVGLLNALGNDADDIVSNLAAGHAPGMRLDSHWLLQGKTCWTGNVLADLPAVPPHLAAHDSRNNRLLLAALEQIRPQVDEAIARFGAERVAVIMGTSTSGLDEADRFISDDLPTYRYAQQELGDPSRFLASYLGITGPAYTLSTACSSSVRAVISGKRLIEAGLADVAIVGGADTLSRMPINGFDSLESLSAKRCAPFSRQRDGISIGEGGALMLIGREPAAVAVLGVGESSDAHHMSAPHPEGLGAQRAIIMALEQAGLAPHELGYINLHGTATRLNDQIEAAVVHQIFGETVPCSSTKHLTGHMLGAAGIGEAALCWLLLTRALHLPAQDFSDCERDDALPVCGLLTAPAPLTRPVILSNSFAFGGNNACLILGKTDE
ncbi:beta-ketoacyl-[acyl-carrier-protein] synthase family protein [Dickeya solani]|uniref:Beta-ketoacyl-[acyl-carrier-protein] synthase family protein n=1 Tax=Dickeya solani TaxID=1089444 RepID=A0ABU4ECF1_9GAMM|nr:beta-ketoacyl-[acyl-carrier-protein] synthase family protein [Dickeya solani]MCA7001003.1 beta-ketoacyl-[acyl-carrier-protein] synthase family protein [Dickeya solani]MCZ0821442.1 beta-ketoacyl-[acyl-carrier-protein] synthase family protein [Dickeya solani]MDV6996645.1 beta-ketoacyl-[acyl-carrier-protein] synthase family protein [Dickeya solani]MDV7002420.1 beta-ketoacyl-[acyl-carrier-protein] synthase family protein [Dickeya solani]MDV7037008.1 beta-ketoacyl-[acyl-carrier-protein] synthase